MTKDKPSYRTERLGDDFYYEWEAYGVAIGFTQLYESHHELYAQISVSSTLPGANGRVHKSRINLDAARSRSLLVKPLSVRVKDVPWDDVLETACTATEEAYRTGPPLINLAEEGIGVPPGYIVEPVIPKGSVTILFGDGGVGKSYLALMLALGALTSTGMPSSLRVKNPVRGVCYLDWEGNKDDQLARFAAIALGMGVEWPEAFWYRNQERPIIADTQFLRSELAKRKVDLVIVDSIGPAVGGSVREEEMVIPTMNALRSLGATVITLAHIPKADREGNGNTGPTSPLGSVMFSNLARSTWEVRRSKEAPENVLQIALYHRKCNFGALYRRPIGIEFTFTSEGNIQTVTPQSINVGAVYDLASKADNVFRIASLLQRGARTTNEIAEELELKEDSVRKLMLRRTDTFVQLDAGGGRGNSARWGLLGREIE